MGKKKKGNNPNKISPFLMLFIIIGVCCIVFGTVSFIKNYNKTKDYVAIKGTYIGAIKVEASSSDDNDTYRLVYQYMVDGQTYMVESDGSFGSTPPEGTVKTIKYNPEDPSQAVVGGFSSDMIVIFFGIMFAGAPLLVLVQNHKYAGVFWGGGFAFAGLIVYLIICSAGDSLSPFAAMRIFGLWVLIPLLFMGVGTFAVITSLFPNLFPKKTPASKQNAKTQRQLQDFQATTMKVEKTISSVKVIFESILLTLIGLGLIVVPLLMIISYGLKAFVMVGMMLVIGIIFFVKGVKRLVKIYRSYKVYKKDSQQGK